MAAEKYVAIESQFQKFCNAAAKVLKDNEHIPGVKFTSGGEGTPAQLRAMGRVFLISLECTVHDQACFGDLRVSVPATVSKDEQVIWRVFIDDLGNVRAKPSFSAPTFSHSVFDNGFVGDLLGEILTRYFTKTDAVDA